MDWTPVTNWLSEHGIRLLIIIVLALVLYYVLRHFVPIMVKRSVAHSMKGRPKTAKKKRTDTLNTVFMDVGVVIIIIISVFTILAEIGINVAPALAGLGIAGIAIGFGAQSLVRDLFNGLFILLENQYGVGDWIQIAGVDGLVEEVTLRRTVVRDFDGTVHSIPNGEVKTSSNFTKEWARANMLVSVGYGEDLDHVTEVINNVGKELAEDPNWAPLIFNAPQVLRVEAFEESGIALRVLGETKQMQQWAVMGELRRRLKRVFDEKGIEIPWPHTKVFFGNTPDNAGIKNLTEPKPPAPSTPQRTKRKRATRSASEYEIGSEGGDGGG